MREQTKYNKNSVIYFAGELSDSIYYIEAGTVAIQEVGTQVSEKKKLLGKGEFFGLFSAIGNYPRQENAISQSDLMLTIFDVKEFESLVINNSSMSLKLLQKLSQELRQVHKKTQKLLDVNVSVSPLQGLYTYGKAYFEKKEYDKATYVLNTFLKYYPLDERVADVKRMLESIK